LASAIRAGRSWTSARATETIEADRASVTRMTHADRNAPTSKAILDFSFSGLKTAVLRHVRSASERPS
jgi:tRNA A37 threonylcarbamoyltransferase TsaD